MPWDHPNFSGSNPNFAPTWQTKPTTGGGQILANVRQLVQNLTGKDTSGTTQYYWDVDNDNDGVPDSVWIDPGLPVVTTKDGRRYKRLAAILIKDLDGSINVNAAGNLAQTTASNSRMTQSRNVYLATTPLPSSGPFVTGNSTALGTALGIAPYDAQLPRGIGVGPAEIFFQNLLGSQAAYTRGTQGPVWERRDCRSDGPRSAERGEALRHSQRLRHRPAKQSAGLVLQPERRFGHWHDRARRGGAADLGLRRKNRRCDRYAVRAGAERRIEQHGQSLYGCRNGAPAPLSRQRRRAAAQPPAAIGGRHFWRATVAHESRGD